VVSDFHLFAIDAEQMRSAVSLLSFGQRRLWFANRSGDPDADYNVPVAVRLAGHLDVSALEAALTDVCRRHETLRTVFAEQDGSPYQIVIPATEVVQELRRSDCAAADFGRAVRDGVICDRALADEATRPFDLTADRPVRSTLFQLATDEHILLLVIHHAFCDGWSLGPLMRDLGNAYGARRAGREPGWDPLPVSYGDYALWHRELLDGEQPTGRSLADEQLAYWSSTLAGLPAELALPHDRPRPVVPSSLGSTVPFELSSELHAALLALARECRASLFMTFQAAAAALLARHGAGADIPLGTTIAGRPDSALDDLVGFFVNTLVLRTDVSGDPSFRNLIGRVRDGNLAAYANQDLPFDRLVGELNPPRARARHPLFQVFLQMHGPPPPAPLPGLVTEVVTLKTDVAHFDLDFSLRERRGPDGFPAGFHGTLQYARDLFDADTAAGLAKRFVSLLAAMTAAPDAAPSAIPTVTADEARLLREWGRGAGDAPVPASGLTVTETFERRVRAMPAEVALVADQESYDYAWLNKRANRLAHQLICCGVKADDRVAVVLPRAADAVITWLAVLKSGGVYLPVDPHHPRERILTVLADAAPTVLVTTEQLVAQLEAEGELPALITSFDEAYPEHDPTDADRPVPLSLDHAAYVIYTSGSTGRPKGVTVLHRALVNELAFHSRVTYPEADLPGDRRCVALSASLSFDTSWEGVWSMMAGHELHLLDEPTRRDPAQMVAYIRRHDIQQIDVTPSFAQQLLTEGLLAPGTPVTTIMLGGEAVTDALWASLREVPGPVKVYNYYGPSEFCVEASGCELTEHPASSIGRPLPNCRVYLLDEQLNLVPPGVVGEIYLAGTQQGRGYLNRAAMTSERFTADPFGEPGTRMYRSGDLGRWTRGGLITYEGRSDEQVKLRGFRIEPGEIRAALLTRPSVAEAAVMIRDDRPDDKRLVAYIVPAGSDGVDIALLRDELAGQLPDYMIPAAFVVLSALPLTRNAKIDYHALPAPDYGAFSSGRAPRTPLEKAVARLFAEILEVDEVSLDDGFFALGGHSLLATQLVNRIRSGFGREFDLLRLFDRPTVADVVGALEEVPPPAKPRPKLVRKQ
jgi:nonribosomal peptide synthetase DhbF